MYFSKKANTVVGSKVEQNAGTGFYQSAMQSAPMWNTHVSSAPYRTMNEKYKQGISSIRSNPFTVKPITSISL